MPLIYSHCEWRCQKTIQLIFGREQENSVEDRMNTHIHTQGEVRLERRKQGKRAMDEDHINRLTAKILAGTASTDRLWESSCKHYQRKERKNRLVEPD